jgi:Mrp family chromosome partitioning ATPase
MRTLLQDVKKDHQIIILDLPPMLSSDDVICILPYVDCALLVAAVGQSKASDVEESIRHLEATPLVRLVLNKSTDNASNYYYSS